MGHNRMLSNYSKRISIDIGILGLLLCAFLLFPPAVFAEDGLPQCKSQGVVTQLQGRVQLNVFLPGVTTPVSCVSDNGAKVTYNILEASSGNELSVYLRGFYVYFVWVVGILATVMVMYAGIQWITAAGNSSRIENAKSTMNGAFIGLVLTLTSYLILQLINPELVRLRVPYAGPITPKFAGGFCQVIDGVDYQSFATAERVECGGIYQYKNEQTGRSVVCMSQWCPRADQACIQCKGLKDPYDLCPQAGSICSWYEGLAGVEGKLVNPSDLQVQKIQFWSINYHLQDGHYVPDSDWLIAEMTTSDHFTDGTEFHLGSGSFTVPFHALYLKLVKRGTDCKSKGFDLPFMPGQTVTKTTDINADDCTLIPN